MANGIYMILCVKTSNVYIGETRNTIHRISSHKNRLKRNIHYTKKLQDDWNVYGERHFVFKVLECSPEYKKEDRLEREEYWINVYRNDSDFNVLNIRCDGTYFSESGKLSIAEKLSARMTGDKHFMWGKEGYWKGKKRPKEFTDKMSIALKGQKRTAEAKKKMSDAKVGKDPHNKFPITDELLKDIESGISYKDFETKYGKSKNTLKRIKRELKGEKRVRVKDPNLRTI